MIAVNAANATNPPETLAVVRQFAVTNRLTSSASFRIALDGRLAARAFGVTSQHTYFLIDRTGRIALKGTGWTEDNEKAVSQKIDVLNGNLPPDYGWRKDLSTSFTRLEEAYGAGRMDEALGAVKLLMPPRTLLVQADYKQLSNPQQERFARTAVQRAISEWKRQVGSIVEIELNEISSEIEIPKPEDKKPPAADPKDKKKDKPKPTKPNVELIFQRNVLDPLDDQGLRTICAVIRVLNEREMGANMRQGTGESPFYVLSRIGLGHANEVHRAEALVHLVGASIARALGLAARDDETSITGIASLDSVTARITIAPSREDLSALANLIATMNLRAGEIYLQKKNYDEAREPLEIVARLQMGATSEKARNYLRELPPPQVR